MTDPRAPASEFSRPVDVARIGAAESLHEIIATPDERAWLARRFGLLGLERLEARVALQRAHGGRLLRLSGHLTADVIQECVVTLEPVPNHIEEDFVVAYGDVEEGRDVSVEVDEDSALEPFPEGPLDIGEAVAQELSLALDPYPHAPGAALTPGAGADGDSAPPGRVNPFSALAKLRKAKP